MYFSHKDASRFLETGKETLGSVTEMPEIDHGVSDQLQAKMVKANPFKSDEKPFELILPGKDPFNVFKAFLKDLVIVKPLSSSLCFFSVPWVFFDIRYHPCIENHLPTGTVVIGRIKACNQTR